MGDKDTPSCTKAVPIKMNSTIGSGNYTATTGDGYGSLTSELQDAYRKMNNSYYNSGGWPACKMRAVLNGADQNTNTDSDYAGSDGGAITKDTCLLSCFPKELQDAIGQKTVRSDVQYDDRSGTSTRTTYDKLWLFSNNELYPTKYLSKASGYNWRSRFFEGASHESANADNDHSGMYQRHINLQSSSESDMNAYNTQNKIELYHGISTAYIWLRTCANLNNAFGGINCSGRLDAFVNAAGIVNVAPGFTLNW